LNRVCVAEGNYGLIRPVYDALNQIINCQSLVMVTKLKKSKTHKLEYQLPGSPLIQTLLFDTKSNCNKIAEQLKVAQAQIQTDK
jgi:hypothetical protein